MKRATQDVATVVTGERHAATIFLHRRSSQDFSHDHKGPRIVTLCHTRPRYVKFPMVSLDEVWSPSVSLPWTSPPCPSWCASLSHAASPPQVSWGASLSHAALSSPLGLGLQRSLRRSVQMQIGPPLHQAAQSYQHHWQPTLLCVVSLFVEVSSHTTSSNCSCRWPSSSGLVDACMHPPARPQFCCHRLRITFGGSVIHQPRIVPHSGAPARGDTKLPQLQRGAAIAQANPDRSADAVTFPMVSMDWT